MRHLFGILVFFVIGTPLVFSADWSIGLEQGLSKINDKSLINPSNLFNLPSKQAIFKTKVLFFEPLGKQVSLSGNFEYQASDKRLNTDNKKSRVIIDSLLFMYNPNSESSIELGKNQLNFGNSLQTDILNLYSTNLDRRNDEGVWALTFKRFFQNGSDLSFLYIPKYDTNLGTEFKNRSEEAVLQMQWNTYFQEMDFRSIISAQMGERTIPFWAFSLSSELSFWPSTIFYIDTKLVNYEKQLEIEKNTIGNQNFYALSQSGYKNKIFSPVLFGINKLFFGKVDLRFEYLYNGYGLSNSQKTLLFEALEQDSNFASQFSPFYSNHLLSRHYINLSANIISIFERTDLFFSWKINMSDKSSIFRLGTSYLLNKNISLSLTGALKMSDNLKSEFGSYIYENDVQLGFTYSFN